MNNILKQRLVGALILVALGVVFWPIIFVEQGVKPLGEVAHIPLRPSVDTTPIEPPDIKTVRQSPTIDARTEDELAERAPAGVVERAPVPDLAVEKTAVVESETKSNTAHQTRKKAPVKPAIDADGIPIAWILQVASVSSRENAEELRLSLVNMGYKAYVKKIKTETSVLLRVYVGPKVERARLETIQPEIDSQFNVKSMIRRYIP
jgi:DedD protein